MSDAPERYPRSEIPASLICPLCVDGPTRSFNSELGFRGHMHSVHKVLYERASDAERKGMSVAELQNLPATRELQRLKPWMSHAIARHELYGETWEEVATHMGRSAGTLAAAANSPAGVEFRAQLHEIMATPASVVKMLMQSATMERYMDWLAALEWAKSARDYKAVHQMLRELGLAPVMAEVDKDRGPTTLVVNFGAEGLDAQARPHAPAKDAGAHARADAEDEIQEAQYTIES